MKNEKKSSLERKGVVGRELLSGGALFLTATFSRPQELTPGR